MTMTLNIQVSSKPVKSSLKIKKGILSDLEELKKLGPFGTKFCLITHDSLVKNHADPFLKYLKDLSLEVNLLTFPSGEKNKTRETKSDLEDQMLSLHMGTDTCLIAMGGGVVTDMGGYLAATYCRGISLVTIPTTLVGMVDASLGGKNGVNVGSIKNRIGTLYHPTQILIDPNLLKTLPEKELRGGYVEMLKHGLIYNCSHFEALKTFSPLTDDLILESCRIKKTVVEENEIKPGVRDWLNFGHTVGHALESLSDYQLSHGEAVALGIMTESYLSWLEGHLSKSSLDVILTTFQSFTLSFKPDSTQMIEKMAGDKKSKNRDPHFVLLQEIGQAFTKEGKYSFSVRPENLQIALRWMIDALYRD